MSRTDFRGRAGLLGLLAVLVLGAACSRPVPPLPEAPPLSPTPAPVLSLPRDAGPHAALTEWWYFTGHLRSDTDERTYGFEFTIFQVQRLAAPTGYLAHFAVTDINGQTFSHQSRVLQTQSDTPPGFPLDVGGWTLASDGTTDVLQADMQAGPGAEPPFGLQLRLSDEKPPALHHGGYIDYGPAGGSYYYSRTRLAASGTLRPSEGDPLVVSGEAWMDHQWGNFVISTAGGWDWYSLQLDDRSELMLYVLRGPDGETTGVYGSQIQSDGSVIDLQPGSVRAEATGQWISPHTGGVYPSGWRLMLADGQQLTLQPQVVDQELYFPGKDAQPQGAAAMAYWEGAVSVSGDRSGVGYVELTGYAGR